MLGEFSSNCRVLSLDRGEAVGNIAMGPGHLRHRAWLQHPGSLSRRLLPRLNPLVEELPGCSTHFLSAVRGAAIVVWRSASFSSGTRSGSGRLHLLRHPLTM